MVLECLRAQELLTAAGIHAEVIDPISLVPLDMDTILASARKTRRLLVVDNAWTSCGASAEILARVAESVRPEDGIVMRRMGFAPTTCPPSPSLEERFYPSPSTIATTVHGMVRPGAPAFVPDPGQAKLAYQLQFRGPF
jgi:pyruvate dehydrogenase E1 component beta subunit